MSTSRRIPFVYAVLISLITLVWFSTVMAQPTPAEKLIAVAPDDVLGFVAQSGGDSVKPAFEKSVLGKLWRDPGAQRFVEDIKQGLLTKLTEEIDDPDVTEVMDTVRGFVRLLLSRPMVVGVAQKETQDGPPIYGFAILDAGPRKAEIAAALTKLEALDSEGDIVDVQIGARTMHGPVDSGDVPGYWGWVGNHLVFSVNDGTGLAMKYLQGNPRVNSEKLQKVPATGDALAIHINQQKLFTLLEDIARMEGAEDEFAIFQAVMKTLGLSDLKNMTTRMGFDGPDMVSNARLKSAQPRRGLLANFKTIDLALFDVVGADAMNASAFN